MDTLKSMENLLSGVAEKEEQEHLGRVMQEFKNSLHYAMLKMNIENTILSALASGTPQGASSDRQLGYLEGVSSFLTVVDGIIAGGIEMEMTSPEEFDEVDNNVEVMVDKPKKRRK